MAIKPVLLCLHGWGGSQESFTELRTALQGTDIEIHTPDLPGFGAEPEPDRPWNVDDYADWVLDYLKNYQLSTINYQLFILGHSHGGRIAIKLVAEKLPATGYRLPNHVFLCAAAGIRHPRHFKRIIGLTLAKTGKLLLSLPGLKHLQPLGKKLLYKLVRVHDYEKASDIMRQTLINVSAEDLRPLLPKITVPTDIFWGTDDGMTPYSDAKVMEADIPGATLHSYPGIRHRVHRDKAKEIAQVIQQKLRAPA